MKSGVSSSSIGEDCVMREPSKIAEIRISFFRISMRGMFQDVEFLCNKLASEAGYVLRSSAVMDAITCFISVFFLHLSPQPLMPCTSLSRRREQMHERALRFIMSRTCEIMCVTAALIIQCH